MQTAETVKLRELITDEIACAYNRIFHKKLPAFLTSTELVLLNVRPRTALDKDVTIGSGLLPLPNTAKGKPRRYLLTSVIDFLAGTSNDK